jgi:hypothetical protein
MNVTEENLAGNLYSYYKIFELNFYAPKTFLLVYCMYLTFVSKVTFANLEATRNELTQTKTTVDELSAKLKGKLE